MRNETVRIRKNMTADIDQMKKTFIICSLVCLIPMATIGGGIYWAVKNYVTYKTYKKTKGEILKLDNKRENKYDVAGAVSYYPKIVYSDDNNQVHVFESKIGSNPPIGRVGERLDILFNPENPKDVVIDSFFYKWFGPTVVSVVGLILLTVVGGISAVVIRNQYKQRKNDL